MVRLDEQSAWYAVAGYAVTTGITLVIIRDFPTNDAMQIFDDYLDREIFLSIRSALEGPDFPWEPSAILKDPPADLDPAYNQQEVHGFFLKNAKRQFVSRQFGIIRPLIEKLAPLDLIKVKLNRTSKKERHYEHAMHRDTQRPGATTAVFYLNTNDGYTAFDDGEKVHSVENRLVLFDAARTHTGAFCTDCDYRLVLNLNMMLRGSPPPH